jgi:hypothetical protein
VEGASDSSLHFRRKRFGTSRAPSTTLRVVPLPRYRGGGCTLPFSRRAFAPELWSRHGKKAFVPPLFFPHDLVRKPQRHFSGSREKKGGGAPKGAPLVPPHRGSAPRVLSLDSVPGRASWNHRIQTGEPSPAPVQPAPGSPVTRRTVDARNRPDMQCIAASPGTAPAPSPEYPREGVLQRAGFLIRINVTGRGTNVK